MIFRYSFILSLLSSIIFYYLSVYLFNFELVLTFKIVGINFFLSSIILIIFFKIIKSKLLSTFKKVKDYSLTEEKVSISFGDDLFNQIFNYYKETIDDLNYNKKRITETHTSMLKKDDTIKKIVSSIKNNSIDIEEDYEELMMILDKIEKTFDDLNITYQKNKLQEENLISKVSKIKVKLSEPEELATTITNEIESSVITLEKERDNLKKLKNDAQEQQEQFKNIKNNISFDISNLEQLAIVNKNLKSIVVKIESNQELEAIYNEFENILSSLKSIDRVEQQKIFKQYGMLNDIFTNTVQKIKTIDLLLLFMGSLTNNINNLKSIIREIQKVDFDVIESKEIREISKLDDLINTYHGTFVNFKNDFQSLIKVIHKY